MKKISSYKNLFETITALMNAAFKLAALIGFLVLPFYFIKIQFVPVGDFQAFAYIFFLIAILAVFLMLFIAANFFAAPYQWSQLFELTDCCLLLTDRKTARALKKGHKTGYFDIPPEKNLQITVWYILFVSVYIASLFLSSYLDLKLDKLLIPVGFFSLFLPKYFPLSKKNERKIKHKLFGIKNSFWRRAFQRSLTIFKIITASVAAGFILIVVNLLILYPLYIKNDANQHSETNFLLFVFLSICLSGACLAPPSNRWEIKKWMLMVGGLTTFSGFILLNIWESTSEHIIHILKLGSISSANITVNQQGCLSLFNQQFPIQCQQADIYLIKNIKIIWRVGEYYIEYEDQNKNKHKLILDNRYVSSISIN